MKEVSRQVCLTYFDTYIFFPARAKKWVVFYRLVRSMEGRILTVYKARLWYTNCFLFIIDFHDLPHSLLLPEVWNYSPFLCTKAITFTCLFMDFLLAEGWNMYKLKLIQEVCVWPRILEIQISYGYPILKVVLSLSC